MSEPEIEEEGWDFWEETGLSCVGYSAALDYDTLAVFKLICASQYSTGIAYALSLPEQYVELLQSIFCSMGWCEYGTSSRGCFVVPGKSADELVSKLEQYCEGKWQANNG